jgi:hypothetical protein
VGISHCVSQKWHGETVLHTPNGIDISLILIPHEGVDVYIVKTCVEVLLVI